MRVKIIRRLRGVSTNQPIIMNRAKAYSSVSSNLLEMLYEAL